MENKMLRIIFFILVFLYVYTATFSLINNINKNKQIETLNYYVDSLSKISSNNQVASVPIFCDCKTVVGQIILDSYFSGMLWDIRKSDADRRSQFVKDSTRISNTYSNTVCNGYRTSWY